MKKKKGIANKQKQHLIRRFCNVTLSSEKTATKYLNDSNYDFPTAIINYNKTNINI